MLYSSHFMYFIIITPIYGFYIIIVVLKKYIFSKMPAKGLNSYVSKMFVSAKLTVTLEAFLQQAVLSGPPDLPPRTSLRGGGDGGRRSFQDGSWSRVAILLHRVVVTVYSMLRHDKAGRTWRCDSYSYGSFTKSGLSPTFVIVDGAGVHHLILLFLCLLGLS